MAKHHRVLVTFAGIMFSGFVRSSGRVTVSTSTLRKILHSGRVNIHCDQATTDDYVADMEANFGRGIVTPEKAEEGLELGKPWLCYLDRARGVIRYCPMQSLQYTISEKGT